MGRSNLKISEVSLGCWVMGGDYWGGAEDQESIKAIHKAVDMGINFFDTAELYGWGRSEEVLGKGLEGYRDKVNISSKVWRTNNSKSDLKKACEDSLKRLRTDYIDVYFIHYPSPDIPLEETMEGMLELKEEGKIKEIGVSNFTVEQMKQVMKVGRFEVVQPCYSLLWRFSEEDLVPFCIENEIGIVGYSPLAQGILTGKFNSDWEFKEGDNRKNSALFQPGTFDKALSIADKLKPFAEKYNKTQAQIAINWSNNQPGITSSIVGARNVRQAEENAEAGSFKLSKEDLKSITDLAKDFNNELPEYVSFFDTKVKE